MHPSLPNFLSDFLQYAIRFKIKYISILFKFSQTIERSSREISRNIFSYLVEHH